MGALTRLPAAPAASGQSGSARAPAPTCPAGGAAAPAERAEPPRPGEPRFAAPARTRGAGPGARGLSRGGGRGQHPKETPWPSPPRGCFCGPGQRPSGGRWQEASPETAGANEPAPVRLPRAFRTSAPRSRRKGAGGRLWGSGMGRRPSPLEPDRARGFRRSRVRLGNKSTCSAPTSLQILYGRWSVAVPGLVPNPRPLRGVGKGDGTFFISAHS